MAADVEVTGAVAGIATGRLVPTGREKLVKILKATLPTVVPVLLPGHCLTEP